MGWSSIEILDKRTLSSKVINNSWRKACHFSPFHVSILAFIALFSTVPEIWNAISWHSVYQIQSYDIKSPPWTIWWFRILGIFFVENIDRLGDFMFQTSDNSFKSDTDTKTGTWFSVPDTKTWFWLHTNLLQYIM